jgi:CBS domain containing-hemolysin-like protein
MTPRPELEWLDLDEDEASIKENLMAMSFTFDFAHGELDNIEGIVLTHKV